jgi:hypothetical protein
MWSLRRRPPDAGAAVTAPTQDLHAWTRALQRGDRAEIARLLCRMATPPAADLDEVRERLADATQREAVAALQRARWGRGDPTEAIAAVRTAFPQGPRWRSQPAAAAMAMPLPPLYPR